MQDTSPTVSFAGHTRTPSTHTLLPKGNLESSISQSVFGLGRNQNMYGRKKNLCRPREKYAQAWKAPSKYLKAGDTAPPCLWVTCTDLYFQYPSLWAGKLPYMSKWVVLHYCGSQNISPVLEGLLLFELEAKWWTGQMEVNGLKSNHWKSVYVLCIVVWFICEKCILRDVYCRM